MLVGVGGEVGSLWAWVRAGYMCAKVVYIYFGGR